MAENWMLKAVLSAKDNMSPALKNIARSAKTTRKYLLDVGNSAVNLAGHIGMPLGLISGALAAFSVAGVKQAVSAFAMLGDEVVKSSKRIGVSTDEYQRIKYVAGQSGVAAEELGSSMGRLNKNIAEAAAGKNKDLAALFKQSGISMRGANGELRNATDMLPELADLFARNGNAAVQARMGNAIFGKSWQSLAPLLQGGRAGIDQLNERYKALGISVEENALVAGEAFGDQMDDMRQVMSSYGNTITAKLLPVLSPLLEKTIQWAVANRDLITTKVSGFITELAEGLSRVDWSGVIKGVGDFVDGVRSFIDFIGGAKNALIGLVLFMNAQAIMATFALLGSIGRLIFGLGILTFKTIPAAITGMGGLGKAMSGAAAKASGLLGTLGKIGAVGGAAFAGWEIGSWLNENVVNPGMEKLTGEKGQTLGGWIYDKMNPDEVDQAPMQRVQGQSSRLGEADQTPLQRGQGQSSRPSLLTPSARAKVEGQVNINLTGLPPGARVEQISNNGNVPANLDAGYSSSALGLAF